jgi:hypothetical protein
MVFSNEAYDYLMGKISYEEAKEKSEKNQKENSNQNATKN